LAILECLYDTRGRAVHGYCLEGVALGCDMIDGMIDLVERWGFDNQALFSTTNGGDHHYDSNS
jgi:hypothetical protein